MNKKEAIEVFRGRQTIFNNVENLIKITKKSSECDLIGQGQLDLFGAGLEVEKANLIPYTGYINVMDPVRAEMDLLGIAVTYDPLGDLDMYFDLYCTHNMSDLFTMSEDVSDIVLIDWIVDIEHKISKKGKPYIKIFTSNFGGDNFFYLWGKNYIRLINQVFINETYMLCVDFMAPTPEFNRESVVCTHLKNIKDVDIDEEYNRVINSAKIIEEMNEDWIKLNKPEWI